MESVGIFLIVFNVILSALTLLLVGTQRLSPDAVALPGTVHTSKKRPGTKIKPVFTDEQKEYAAEQQELKSRPAVL